MGSDERPGLVLSSIREIAQCHRDMEQELAHAVNASAKAMDRVYSKPRSPEVPAPSCSCLSGLVEPSGFYMVSLLVPRRG